MAIEKTSPEFASDEDSISSKEAKKRIAYPSKSLKDIIEFVGKIYNSLGHTDFLSNKAIAAVHELSTDTIKPYLSAAQAYKIFELKHGTGYKVTDHFRKLYLPKNDSEKRASVIESLKHSEIYLQLFKDYEYNVVPSEGVKNHFLRSGFKEEVAVRASQVFLENLKDFGLTDSRGVLTSALPLKASVTEVITETIVEANNNNQQSTGNPENNANQLPAVNQPSNKYIFQSEIDAIGKKPIPIYLTNAKQAMFVYPDDITEDDIELVKHQIEGILLRIKLETKTKAADAAK